MYCFYEMLISLFVIAENNWGTCEDGTEKLGCGDQEEFFGCSDIRILTPEEFSSNKFNDDCRSSKTKILTSEVGQVSMYEIKSQSVQYKKNEYLQRSTKTIDRYPITTNNKQLSGFSQNYNIPINTPKIHNVPIPPKAYNLPSGVVENDRSEMKSEVDCVPLDVWKDVQGMEEWCKLNCVRGNANCKTHCSCAKIKKVETECLILGIWKDVKGMDEWCAANCMYSVDRFDCAGRCDCSVQKKPVVSKCSGKRIWRKVKGMRLWCEANCSGNSGEKREDCYRYCECSG